MSKCTTCREKNDEISSLGCNHGLCPDCWVKFLSRSLAKSTPAFLAGELTCPGSMRCFCRMSMEKQKELCTPALTEKWEQVLATVPKTRYPTTIDEFGYEYDSETRLRNKETKDKYAFVSQRHYEKLGDIVVTHIQKLLVEDCGLQEKWLPEEKARPHPDVKTNVFMSEDALSNPDRLLILIQGAGAVRAGQWARALCINESLDIGTIIPYVKRGMAQGYGIIVLNPNNSHAFIPKDDKKPEVFLDADDEAKAALEYYINTEKKVPADRSLRRVPIPQHRDYQEHTISMWDQFISKAVAKEIAIVAHSRGGVCTMDLLRYRGQDVFKRLKCVAFTDSVHGVSPRDPSAVRRFIKENAVNWVTSSDPLDTPQRVTRWTSRSGCPCVSAGHEKHEYTSGCAFESVFEFLASKVSGVDVSAGRAAVRTDDAQVKDATDAKGA